MDWHELPVMYCFHRMPRTLKTSHNWPRSRSAIQTYSKCDMQWGEMERGGEEEGGGRNGEAV